MINPSQVILLGYSGHAFVVCDIFLSQNFQIIGYCEEVEKHFNPYNLTYLGHEKSETTLKNLKKSNYFIAVGNSQIRQKISNLITEKNYQKACNAIHKNASVSQTAVLGKGIMIGNGAIINACATLEDGVICNTQAVIEHESIIGQYSHIAPGAILCGNTKIGRNTFIGARTVVKEGVKIGDNVIVGAGTVVINDIPNNSKVVGNPQRNI